uniref:ISY1 splicing factor-like protein n=1 Tax=Plectus sambesii TaxID=2011161 RepID=A0A914WC53_9BILA
MARNAEKAMTALARWRRMKESESKGPVQRRPADTRDCTDVRNAERFRKEIVMDIAKKIAMIQNPGLGEFKIRDLNDEINKQLKLKFAWESRIKELGGPDYRRIAPKLLDKEGREVAGSRGYKYFGAAKDLPGVRELFEKADTGDASKKNRADMMKNIDADYYGYMDDDDGLLVPLEQEEERRAIAAAVEAWTQRKESTMDTGERRMDTGERRRADSDDEIVDDDPEDNIYRVDDDEDEDDVKTTKTVIIGEDGKPTYIQHVPVPSQKDIEEALLERKKAELLEKYVNETLSQQSSQAATLMGYTQSASLSHHSSSSTNS